MRILLNWLLSALAVWVVSRVVPGFHVAGLAAALIAALVIGFVNATLGLLLKIITLPLTVLTLGIFWFVINALMLEMAAAVVPGFRVDSFTSAFWGAIVLSLVNMLFRWLAGTGRKEEPRVVVFNELTEHRFPPATLWAFRTKSAIDSPHSP